MGRQAAAKGEGAGGGDQAGLVPVRLDGKTIRGEGPHIMAAMRNLAINAWPDATLKPLHVSRR